MSHPSLIFAKIEHYIKTHALFEPGDRLFIGCSGGADSVFLLIFLSHYYLNYSSELPFIVVYFNHGLRLEAAMQEQLFVESLCVKIGCRFVTESLDVKGYAASCRVSTETAGRQLRLEAFGRLSESFGITKVLLAHHQDDVCETFFHRLIRGAKTGLGSIKPLTLYHRLRLIRPLLQVSKADILAYLEDNKIPFCEDESNHSLIYTRNLIRQRLLPVVEEMNPSYRHTIGNIIDYLDDSQTYLASVLSPLKAHIHYTAGRGAIELGIFDNIHPFIQKQLIFDMIHSVIGYEVEISSKQVLAVWKLLSGQSGKQINLSGGFRALRNQTQLVIEPVCLQSCLDYQYAVESIPATLAIPEANLSFQFSVLLSPEPSSGKSVLYLPMEKFAKKTFIIRNRRVGERVAFSSILTSLKKILIELKVPFEIRNRVPLLFVDDELLWISNYKASSNYAWNALGLYVLKVEVFGIK